MIRDQSRAHDIPAEDIDTHGRQVAVRLFGFLREFTDAAVFIEAHDTEAAGFFPGNLVDGDGKIGIGILVDPEHVVVVHLVQMVAREHQDMFRIVAVHIFDVSVDRICRTVIPVAAGLCCKRRKHGCTACRGIQIPGFTGADIAMQGKRLVLCQDADGVDP